MTVSLIKSFDPKNDQHLYFAQAAWVGSIAIAWGYLEPESLIGQVSATAVGIAGPVITLIGSAIFCELGRRKLNKFFDKNRCHLTFPAIDIDIKKYKAELARAFQRIKQLGAYETFKKTEGLVTDVEAHEALFRREFGTCRAQTLELWDRVLVNNNLPSSILLRQVKQTEIEDIIYRQIASLLHGDITRPVMSREEKDLERVCGLICNGSYLQETNLAKTELSHILVYEKLVEGKRFSAIEEEETWTNAFNEVAVSNRLIGEVWLHGQKCSHSIFVQSTPSRHRFYDIAYGMYEYSDRENLIKGLRAHVLYSREEEDVSIRYKNALTLHSLKALEDRKDRKAVSLQE